ncbi:hypothetical protein CSOJ01_06560 [Colletotrichum sojae]|uniref:Uncharacterized protein n=1 Tax=Colletotrichum sojae TaxID=2175907 RepID=A0A8H6JBQ9_9PEZI|nr:hypothetical protein CSOJ01_06560 [Colletotrichum sojae]
MLGAGAATASTSVTTLEINQHRHPPTHFDFHIYNLYHGLLDLQCLGTSQGTRNNTAGPSRAFRRGSACGVHRQEFLQSSVCRNTSTPVVGYQSRRIAEPGQGCVLTHRLHSLSRIRQIEIALTTGSLHPTSVAAPSGSDTTAVRPKGGGRWHDGLAGHAGYSTNAAPTSHPPVTGSAVRRRVSVARCMLQHGTGPEGSSQFPVCVPLSRPLYPSQLAVSGRISRRTPRHVGHFGSTLQVEERSSTLAERGLHSKKNEAARFDKATEA